MRDDMNGIYIAKGSIMDNLYAFSCPFYDILTFCNLSVDFAYTRKCQPKDFFLWHFLFVIFMGDLVSKMLV